MKKSTIAKLLVFALILLVITIFFVVSICLAVQNGHSLINEWQSWFGLLKENVDNIVEQAKLLTFIPIK